MSTLEDKTYVYIYDAIRIGNELHAFIYKEYLKITRTCV